ncbi:unnamed protein product, partial [marine sediment metagenome]
MAKREMNTPLVKPLQSVTDRGLRQSPVAVLALPVVASLFAPALAHGQYTESNQTWTASAKDTWEVQDLSGAPFNVPANAVVEVVVTNRRGNFERWGGVRTLGSSLDRRFQLQEAEPGGWDVVVMHAQTDPNSRIEHYADDTTDIVFVLLGYWTCGTYVEKMQSFKAGANLS